MTAADDLYTALSKGVAHAQLRQHHIDTHRAEVLAEADPWPVIDRLVAWLDQNNGRSHNEITLRLLKISEEAGEVAQAWIGYTGQNPRKGVTHSARDVADELCDVIVTAMVALGCVSDHPARHFAGKLAEIAAKRGAGKDTRVGGQSPAGESTQPAPDFFQPDRTYRYHRWAFRCDAVTTHPQTGERHALGWFRQLDGTWKPYSSSEDEWAEGSWTEAADVQGSADKLRHLLGGGRP